MQEFKKRQIYIYVLCFPFAFCTFEDIKNKAVNLKKKSYVLNYFLILQIYKFYKQLTLAQSL